MVSRRPGYRVFTCLIFIEMCTGRLGYRVFICSIVVNMFRGTGCFFVCLYSFLVFVDMLYLQPRVKGVLFHVPSTFTYLLWFTRHRGSRVLICLLFVDLFTRRPGFRVFICSIFVDLFTRRPGYRVFTFSIVVNIFTRRPGYRVFLSMFTFALSLCLYALPAARGTGCFTSWIQ